MARSGARWRDLPERFGSYDAVKRCYYRWIERGALGGFLAVLTADTDLEWLMIDSTIVRAHQHAAGTRVAKGGLMLRGWAAPLGRSRGGLSTKVHAATDALGNPVRLLLGPGQHHDVRLASLRPDVTRGHDLIGGLELKAVIADKGYDADHLHQAVRDAGAEPVIPARANRRTPRVHDKALYRERNLIERFFSKLKQFRHVATRYDKLLANYEGFVQLAAIAILLR